MERVSFRMESPMPAIAKKARLSVRNWHEYNESLVARGSITIWFSDEALANWYHENGVGKRGRPFMYSDSTMELFLTVRELWRLPYRQTEGLVRGIPATLADGLSAVRLHFLGQLRLFDQWKGP